MSNRVNCLKCKYYFVTWDKKSPHGCRYFNFKTKVFPSIYVFKSSGSKCKAFEQK